MNSCIIIVIIVVIVIIIFIRLNNQFKNEASLAVLMAYQIIYNIGSHL